jgi:hypothetical protein
MMNAGILRHRHMAGAARPGVSGSLTTFAFTGFTMPPEANRQVNAWIIASGATKAAYPVICAAHPARRPLERSP